MKKKRKSKKPSSQFFQKFRGFAALLFFVLSASLLLVDPSAVKYFSANLNEPLSDQSSPTPKGFLITAPAFPMNDEKLRELGTMLLPESSLQTASYQSPEGAAILREFGIHEVPALILPRAVAQNSPKFSLLGDLFQPKDDALILDTRAVNPSYELRLDSVPPGTESALQFGSDKASVTAFLFSDVTCQDCRVLERNTLSSWQSLMTEGLVRLVVVDTPSSDEGLRAASALDCFASQEKSPEDYWKARREFLDSGQSSVEDLRQCDSEDTKKIFEQRKQTAFQYGIQTLPALVIGKTGGQEYLRLTGAKDFSEYQKVMDQILK